MRKKKPSIWLQTCLPVAFMLLATSCERSMLRSVVNRVCSPDKKVPSVYHEAIGYSPGTWKSRVEEEDFSRYHYYISPDPEELLNSDPQIYFRQDYDYPEADVPFDEEKYWQEHPIQLENHPPGMEEEILEIED